MTMKSAAICTILLSLQTTAANGRAPPFNRNGIFTRPGWRSNSATVVGMRSKNTALVQFPRGGEADSAVAEETSLDDRVNAAMARLGIDTPSPPPPPPPPVAEDSGIECEGGVCTIDDSQTAAVAEDEAEADDKSTESSQETSTEAEAETPAPLTEEHMFKVADTIATEMSVPTDIALAAIYSSFTGTDENRQINEETARSIVQSEVDAMAGVPEDSPEVTQLAEEGFDVFFARRSLAFSDMNVDNARAILMADREDEEAERADMEKAQAEAEARQQEEEAKPFKTVNVDYPTNFDPMAGGSAPQKPQQQQKPQGAPTPAKKEDVIFEGTTEELQKLVIESPVPVLLDVYADWCGPCKQLTPALEQICINAGGMLRLVKINTDQQRQISSALEVKALPTIFGIRDGRILNSWQGMPRDEQMVRDFLMGLMVPGQNFKPPVSAEDKDRYDDLSSKLLKLAAGASFSFSQRESLQTRMAKLLDELVDTIGGETGMAVADDSARVLRSLMSNVIANPFEEKFRKIKLDNKVIAAKVAKYQPCIALLKSIGFAQDGDSVMVVAKGKRVVNMAPLVVARDCIDKWIDKNRYHIAAAGRKRKDEMGRARLAKEAEEAAREAAMNPPEEEEEESEDEVDLNLCTLKLRLEGKKKVHDIEMDGSEHTLSTLLEKLPFPVEDGEIVQFTCAAKRLIVKSTDSEKMSKTLSQLRLMPSASIVVKIGEGKADVAKGSLAERAASKGKKTTGSHSMHSIGLYAQDDGNKHESFESGGVLYDHVLSDDEEEGEGVDAKEGNKVEEVKESDDSADDDTADEESAAEEEDEQ